MKKNIFSIMIAIMMLTSVLSGCGATQSASVAAAGEAAAQSDATVTTGEIAVFEDGNFGSIQIDESLDSFHDLGFDYGDSVNVVFDNGTELNDLPYYSGYYGPFGDLILCGYDGYEHVVVARINRGATWDEFGMTPESLVTVTLNEKGKYKEFEDANSIHYSDDRSDYSSDVVFANFRESESTGLAPGLLFRSASPCDNVHNRAPYANALAEEAGIRLVLNLSDGAEEYQEHKNEPGFSSDYYDGLVQEGNVLFLNLTPDYSSDEYRTTLSQALLTMTDHEGPCLVHCVEGKDRTGFVCALMEALAGGTYDEILTDYMITYDNYYGVTKETDPEKYDIITEKAKEFFYEICEVPTGTSPEGLDLQEGARNYLRRGGLSDEEIDRICHYLRGE